MASATVFPMDLAERAIESSMAQEFETAAERSTSLRRRKRPGGWRPWQTVGPCAAFPLLGLLFGCNTSGDPVDSQTLALCERPAGPAAPAPLRRLTRFEYGRTVHELTGADPEIALRLPPDEESFGFDNNADAYSISTLHTSKYLEVAEAIAERLVGDSERLRSFADCDPVQEAACVGPFVSAFGQRAYRRPLEEAESQGLLGLYEATAEDDAADGLLAVIATVLQSPQFLYRPETPEVSSTAKTVDAHSLATRLSYLLVGTGPDAELLAAAADGSLLTEEGLDAHTDRLLAQPAALESFLHFLLQWFELDELDTLEKDRTLIRGWSSDMPNAFAAELEHFVADAWQRDPTLKTLLGASHTFLDARLAAFYGVPAPAETGFRRVELDPSRAAGLLTQGALLASHAKANQTSPVERGKFVRARLFCKPPPPPPPDLVVAAPAVNPRLSTRERFAQHASDPACSGCHRLMDPIGFAFENYDAAGRWRDMDGGEPVDAVGELLATDVDGSITGVPELAARLLASAEVRHCVATQWFRYAFGRSEQNDHDTCTIEALEGSLGREGNLRNMVRATVRQPLFAEAPALQGDASEGDARENDR